MPSCFHSHLRTQNICLIFIFFAQTGPLNLFVFFIKMVEFGIKLPRKSWYAVKTQNTITLQRKVIVACVRNDCEKNERKKKKKQLKSLFFFRSFFQSCLSFFDSFSNFISFFGCKFHEVSSSCSINLRSSLIFR